MTWASVLFWGWMTIGWLPNGSLGIYENPTPHYLTIDGSYFAEVGTELTWGCFFAGGAARTTMWDVREGLFWPNQMEFTFDTGVKLGGVRVGWKHCCYHPMGTGMVEVAWLGGQIRPRWEGGYDEVYLHVEGGKR